MKHLRFYMDHGSKAAKRQRLDTGSVLAVVLNDESGRRPIVTGYSTPYGSCYTVECIGSLFTHRNSPVASTSASVRYIRECCTRISEQRARQAHPALFEYLES